MVRTRWLLSAIIVFLVYVPALAQANPTATPCGLPAAGTITAPQNYTLDADCAQTGELKITGSGTVSINGAGFAIRPASTFSDSSLITLAPSATLDLDRVSIDGSDVSIAALITTGGGGFVANDVTFRGSNGVNLNVDGDATLTDVLFEGNASQAFHGGGNGSALNVSSFGGAVTITNAVFRDNYYGGGAIAVNASGSGSVTTGGCLTFSGNVPYNVVGTWTDNSRVACTGTIGNRDQAVIAAPARLSCGLPGAGHLDRPASYVLRSDCDLSGSSESVLWTISEGVNINIQGNGYRLSAGSGSDWRWIEQAGNGRLNLRNVVVDHVKFFSFGTMNVDQATFRDTSDRVFFHLGDGTFRNSLFENIATTRPSNNASVLLALDDYGGGNATFTNTVFRKNSSSGAPVLNTSGSSTITLNGCIIFEGNTAPNFGGNVVDNSIGQCGTGVVIGPIGPIPDEPRADQPWISGNCFQRLGAIGIICRPIHAHQPAVQVWGISSEGTGFFILETVQSQVDALHAQGIVSSSADGRVAVRLVGPACITRGADDSTSRVTSPECIAWQLRQPDGPPPGSGRHIVISMGPNFEGKVHSVILEKDLAGHVIGTVDTYTGLPGNPASANTAAERPPEIPAPAVTRQAARADGSIIHVVQQGNTVSAIAFAYGVSQETIVELNGLSAGGHMIVAGQELVIRKGN